MIINAFIGDITNVHTEVAVNAAAKALEGGGGVDGAIHRAAGPQLLEECKTIGFVSEGVRCPTGEARITMGYDMPNKYIVHTVGPDCRHDDQKENRKQLLRNCYENSMRQAAARGCESIAFPAISTGIFAMDLEEATIIAVKTVMDLSEEEEWFDRMVVNFVCFDEHNFLVYDRVIKAASSGWSISSVSRSEVR